mgnify:CR=1 FL=1
MLDYTKEELLSLIENTPERFNEWKRDRDDVDLSEVDFSNMVIKEVKSLVAYIVVPADVIIIQGGILYSSRSTIDAPSEILIRFFSLKNT